MCEVFGSESVRWVVCVTMGRSWEFLLLWNCLGKSALLLGFFW